MSASSRSPWASGFPDVFNKDRHGFSAVIGNPPWETLQPNSKEWFSNVDPLYRTYGKQAALIKQKDFFTADDTTERTWLQYNAFFKAFAGWFKWSGIPFDKKQHLQTKIDLVGHEHPFIHQGEGKPYTYKMFFEVCHAILKSNE